jgi:hypothetical protein
MGAGASVDETGWSPRAGSPRLTVPGAPKLSEVLKVNVRFQAPRKDTTGYHVSVRSIMC